MEVNPTHFAQRLAISRLVDYTYIFRGSSPLTEFCQVQNSLCLQSCVLYWIIGSVTARHLSSGRQPNLVAWYKEWNYGTFAPRHFRSREGK